MTKITKYTVLNSLVLCALASSVMATEEETEYGDWLSRTYTTANIGRANSHVTVNEVQAEFNAAGITNTTINEVDSRRIGFGLGLGYEICANWAVELAYLDLNQVDVDFTSTQAINMDDVHPESGDGFTLSILYKYALDTKTHARLRLGMFDWEAEYRTSQGNGSTTGKDSDSGTDMYWGAGLGHQMTNEFTLVGEIQNFDFDRDNTTYLTIGAEWRY